MYILLPDLGRVLSLHSNLQRWLGITIKLWTPIRFLFLKEERRKPSKKPVEIFGYFGITRMHVSDHLLMCRVYQNPQESYQPSSSSFALEAILPSLLSIWFHFYRICSKMQFCLASSLRPAIATVLLLSSLLDGSCIQNQQHSKAKTRLFDAILCCCSLF